LHDVRVNRQNKVGLRRTPTGEARVIVPFFSRRENETEIITQE